jgi:hypothetical protein
MPVAIPRTPFLCLVVTRTLRSLAPQQARKMLRGPSGTRSATCCSASFCFLVEASWRLRPAAVRALFLSSLSSFSACMVIEERS